MKKKVDITHCVNMISIIALFIYILMFLWIETRIEKIEKVEVHRDHWDKGNLYSETYHKEGKRYHYHREDGPAVVKWDEDGSKLYEQYWIDGKQYTKEEYDKKIYNKRRKL